MTMAELLEAFMVVGFGISWPASIVKSLQGAHCAGEKACCFCA